MISTIKANVLPLVSLFLFFIAANAADITDTKQEFEQKVINSSDVIESHTKSDRYYRTDTGTIRTRRRRIIPHFNLSIFETEETMSTESSSSVQKAMNMFLSHELKARYDQQAVEVDSIKSEIISSLRTKINEFSPRNQRDLQFWKPFLDETTEVNYKQGKTPSKKYKGKNNEVRRSLQNVILGTKYLMTISVYFVSPLVPERRDVIQKFENITEDMKYFLSNLTALDDAAFSRARSAFVDTDVDTDATLSDANLIAETNEDTANTSLGSCYDDPMDWYDLDGPAFDCDWYAESSIKAPDRCGDFGDGPAGLGGKTANQACCVCGGGTSISSSPSNQISDLPSTMPTRKPTPKPTKNPTKPPTNGPTLEPKENESESPSLSTAQVMQPSSIEATTATEKSSLPSSMPSVSLAPSGCIDIPKDWYDLDGPKYNCSWYGRESTKEDNKCTAYGDSFANFGKTANQACCVCGGGSDATPNPSLEPSTEPSEQPTDAPSPSPSSAPSPSPSVIPTSMPTMTPTTSTSPSFLHSDIPSSSAGPSTHPSSNPSPSPSSAPSLSPSMIPTSMPTVTPTTSKNPSQFPSDIPSLSGSPSTAPSSNPSPPPSPLPSPSPSSVPSPSPSSAPSASPSMIPTSMPTVTPTISISPSQFPSDIPSLSGSPSTVPSSNPSPPPSPLPSPSPSSVPSTELPSGFPSSMDSTMPSSVPTDSIFPSSMPTELPTISVSPSSSHSDTPSSSSPPSTNPSSNPSSEPWPQQSAKPSSLPTVSPTNKPTLWPSPSPSSEPSPSPSVIPTSAPTMTPTISSSPSFLHSDIPSSSAGPSTHPSSNPSSFPSLEPSATVSLIPSSMPSERPTTSTSPSQFPTDIPSLSGSPSTIPSPNPSPAPSPLPSPLPSSAPSPEPSPEPSIEPSLEPSLKPSIEPSTELPSSFPSSMGSASPSLMDSAIPSSMDSAVPSSMDSVTPSVLHSTFPSSMPTESPSTATPSGMPSLLPTENPSAPPSSLPSLTPTWLPSSLPSWTPSIYSSSNPSQYPSTNPSLLPTDSMKPTGMPSRTPTISISPSDLHSGTPSSSVPPSIRPTTEFPSISPSSVDSTTPSLSTEPTRKSSESPSINPSFTSSVSIKPSNSPSTSSDLTTIPTVGAEEVSAIQGTTFETDSEAAMDEVTIEVYEYTAKKFISENFPPNNFVVTTIKSVNVTNQIILSSRRRLQQDGEGINNLFVNMEVFGEVLPGNPPDDYSFEEGVSYCFETNFSGFYNMLTESSSYFRDSVTNPIGIVDYASVSSGNGAKETARAVLYGTIGIGFIAVLFAALIVWQRRRQLRYIATENHDSWDSGSNPDSIASPISFSKVAPSLTSPNSVEIGAGQDRVIRQYIFEDNEGSTTAEDLLMTSPVSSPGKVNVARSVKPISTEEKITSQEPKPTDDTGSNCDIFATLCSIQEVPSNTSTTEENPENNKIFFSNLISPANRTGKTSKIAKDSSSIRKGKSVSTNDKVLPSPNLKTSKVEEDSSSRSEVKSPLSNAEHTTPTRKQMNREGSDTHVMPLEYDAITPKKRNSSVKWSSTISNGSSSSPLRPGFTSHSSTQTEKESVVDRVGILDYSDGMSILDYSVSEYDVGTTDSDDATIKSI